VQLLLVGLRGCKSHQKVDRKYHTSVLKALSKQRFYLVGMNIGGWLVCLGAFLWRTIPPGEMFLRFQSYSLMSPDREAPAFYGRFCGLRPHAATPSRSSFNFGDTKMQKADASMFGELLRLKRRKRWASEEGNWYPRGGDIGSFVGEVANGIVNLTEQ
jgi:hypothetical protein